MHKKDDNLVTPKKKLRFRGDLNLHHFNENRLEDIADREFDDEVDGFKSSKNSKSSLYDFVKVELTRGYVPEHDEERYSARREKIYSFMRIPRELEKFLAYGFLQCADSFLFIYTFLPFRYLTALWGLMTRPVMRILGLRRRGTRLLAPAEICDLLKGSIWVIVTVALIKLFDTNMLYHLIKSQSIIKLYIFYNMLEVGDRLLSAFGQDTIDALFWTATEPRNRRTDHLGLIPHICFAMVYIGLHSTLIMFQATTLSVAINSNNKGLLTIMMSNNFVEIKGSVFKKFDKNNLFQLTCSDVRERFHLVTLLVIVIIQTMRELDWRSDYFVGIMYPCCLWVLATEFFVDWIKHAFITRFNEITQDVYHEYTVSLAYDMMQTRQKHAFSDPSDLLARRMGFIPFPLGCVLTKAVYHAITFDNFLASLIIGIVFYIFCFTCRILITIVALGKACDLMEKHEKDKIEKLPQTPMQPKATTITTTPKSLNTSDVATSPIHTNLQRSQSQIIDSRHHSTSSPDQPSSPADDILRDTSNFGATAIFSNSDVDLDDVRLNENILTTPTTPESPESVDENSAAMGGHRTHRRSESEPSIQLDTNKSQTNSPTEAAAAQPLLSQKS